MSGFQETSPAVRRTIFAGIAGYFVLFVYDATVGAAWAELGAQILFGAVAVAVGALLYRYEEEERTQTAAAAVLLVAGGLAQLGWLVTGWAALNSVATFSVFFGVGIYLYVSWVAE